MLKWQHDGTRSTEGEARQLIYALVSCTKPAICLETGTHAGHTTKAISKALEANDRGQLITVESDREIYEQYKSLERTTFLFGDSLEYVRKHPGLIDFAFIDCGEPDHRLKVAIELKPKVRGLMVIHDTIYYPEFLHSLEQGLGPCSLHVKTLHGLTIWDCS